VAVAGIRPAGRRGAHRGRQLAAVEIELLPQIALDPAIEPADAGVMDRDDHVGPTGLGPPGDLDAHAAHPEELVRTAVHERVGGTEVRARVLPLVAVAAPGRAAHLVGERDAARGEPRAVA